MSAKSSVSGNATLALNGTDQMADVTSTASIELSGAQTWSCWINLNVNSAKGVMMKTPSTVRGPAIRMASSRIYATFYPTVGSASNAVDLHHTTVLSTGVWHHVVLRYDGSEFMYVEVDGVVESTNYLSRSGGTALIGTSTDDLAIGAWGDFGAGPSNPMNGDIALPMIFNADIDTSELIDGSGNARAYSALPIGLKSDCVFAPTLVNDIPSNGQEETDQSSSSNDATLIGSPTYTGEALVVAT